MATSDAVADPSLSTGAHPGGHGLLFNGTTWDRQRNNHEVTVLASAARTTAPDAVDLVNYNAVGVVVVVSVTAVDADPAVTVTIQGVVGDVAYDILASSAIATVSTTVLRVHPTITASANSKANDVIPRNWRVSVAHGDSDSATYSITASYLMN